MPSAKSGALQAFPESRQGSVRPWGGQSRPAEMTSRTPLSQWDPFRPMEMLAALWSSKLTRGVGTGPPAGYRTLFDTLCRLMVGRRLTVRLRGDDVKLTIKELDAHLDVRSLSVGQLRDVHIVAEDICCGQHKMTRAQAHLRGRPSAVLRRHQCWSQRLSRSHWTPHPP
jgi:hypothetical protein